MRISKKILACVLAALMAIAMMPMTAFADGNVATIGETGYATIAEAYAACQPGQTITLVDDITGPVEFNRRTDSTLTKDSVFTLDLNGHSITAPSGQHALKLCMKHQLVIADSSEGHTGCIEASGNGNAIYLGYKVGSNYNTGKLTITGGTIRAVARAIYNPSSTCRIVVDGENVNIVSTNVDAIGINKSSAALEIHNGTIDGKDNGVYVYTSSEVTIDGGEISGDNAASIKTASTLDISGGTFEGTTSAINYTGNKTGFISGGTFSDDVSEYAAASYTAVKDVSGNYVVTTIDGNVAKVDGVLYETFAAAYAAAQAGNTITLLDDVTVNTGASSSSRYAISKSLTIDGGNHTVSINNRGFGVGMNASGEIDVTFKNITITNATNAGRCIDTRGNINSLTLDNVTLKTTGTSGYLQPLTIGGNQATTATVNITDSTIQTSDDGSKGYAIITFNPVAMTITDSTIKGWACIYAKGVDGSAGSAGSTFTATGSNFVSKNTNPGTTNAFGTLVVEDSDIDFNITNCNISIDGEANHQYLFTNNEAYLKQYVNPNAEIEDVTVALGEGNNVDLKAMGDFSIGATDDVKLEISGGYFSKVVPGECCAEGYAAIATPDASGKYTVGKPNDGTNITVADEISQNFYIDDDFYGEDAYVAVTYNTNTNVEESATIGTEITRMGDLPVLTKSGDYNGNRIVSITQAPAQVTENVKINVYASQADAEAGTNAVKTLTYSTYDYCTTILETPNAELGEKATELKELAETTLDYAAAAQTYFNYNTDNMATADNAGNDFYNDVQDTVFEGIDTPSFANFKSLTVVVKSDLEINLLVLNDFEVNSYSYNPAKGGSRFGVSTHYNGGYNVLHIKGIEPANMDENITVDTSIGNVEISANAIMKILSKTGNANLATLAKAMYRYGQAANAYFD